MYCKQHGYLLIFLNIHFVAARGHVSIRAGDWHEKSFFFYHSVCSQFLPLCFLRERGAGAGAVENDRRRRRWVRAVWTSTINESEHLNLLLRLRDCENPWFQQNLYRKWEFPLIANLPSLPIKWKTEAEALYDKTKPKSKLWFFRKCCRKHCKQWLNVFWEKHN